MVNAEQPAEPVLTLLRAWLGSFRPTPNYRRRAWREFQRALDPLAAPRPLDLDRPSSDGGHVSGA